MEGWGARRGPFHYEPGLRKSTRPLPPSFTDSYAQGQTEGAVAVVAMSRSQVLTVGWGAGGEGVLKCSRVGVGGAFVGAVQIKGLDEDSVSVCLHVCLCSRGMGVTAVNLNVSDRKTVADHYHKSDKR